MRVLFLLGSASDMDHAKSIVGFLSEDWGIPSEILIGSAHKVPEKVFALIQEKNLSSDPLVWITIAGRSNALSGVVAGNSIHPVIACPPFKDNSDLMVNIHSTLQMPSETPVLTVLDPSNCAATVARMFALSDEGMREKVKERIEKIKKGFSL